MDADKIEDLSRMYILLSRIGSLNELKQFFGTYVKVSSYYRYNNISLSIEWILYIYIPETRF
jgi:hypothetical protein